MATSLAAGARGPIACGIQRLAQPLRQRESMSETTVSGEFTANQRIVSAPSSFVTPPQGE